MKTTFIIWFVLVLLLINEHDTYAQDECELTLNEALEEFNAGHFSLIPGLLEACLNKRQNREWRQRAYLLLAETYLLLENSEAAKNSYLEVLRANPEYLTERTRDPIDLVYLSSRFTASPIFVLFGKIGPNVSPIRVIHDVDIGGEEYTSEKYSLAPGYQAGLGADWNYSEKLALSLEFNYTRASFSYKSQSLFGVARDNLQLKEDQTSITVPLLVKYGDNQGKYRPYVYGGFSGTFLSRADGNIIIEDRNLNTLDINPTQTFQSQDRESPTLSFTQRRNKFNVAFVAGGGLKYKLGLNYIYFDLRYSLAMTNSADPYNRFDQLVYEWPYVDDDFYLDNLAFSIGYIHPLYKPRELKRAKSKSVLRKIKKDNQ